MQRTTRYRPGFVSKTVNFISDLWYDTKSYVVEPFISGAFLALGQFFVRKLVLHYMYKSHENETALQSVTRGITGFFNKLIGK
jgi:hypothetical protein